MLKIWVGKRESDIETYKYFNYSISYYGSNINNNRSFCNENRISYEYSNEFTSFVIDNINELIKLNKDVEIHFYNNVFAHKIISKEPLLASYIVNLNSIYLLNLLRHKTLSRLWLKNSVETPDFTSFSKEECNINNLMKKFNGYMSFVIQDNYSGGGQGTYLMTKDNCDLIVNELNGNKIYLVSPYYYPNQSYSCHIMIDSKNVIVFPISEQLLSHKNDKMSYCGNLYNNLSKDVSEKIREQSKIIGTKLREIGYRGVCGLDYIKSEEKVLLIEINPRYQGSSYVINEALKLHELPSLFELNSKCFSCNIDEKIANDIEKMNIDTKNYYCTFDSKTDLAIIENIINQNKAKVFLDGCLTAKNYDDNVYLFRYFL